MRPRPKVPNGLFCTNPDCGKPLTNEQTKYCCSKCNAVVLNKRVAERRAAGLITSKPKAMPHNCICPHCRKSHYRERSHKWRYCVTCEKLFNSSPDDTFDPDVCPTHGITLKQLTHTR